VHQPVEHQPPRGLHLGAAVRAIERAEIDQQRRRSPDPLGCGDLALDRDVALRVRHDRQLPAHAHLEELVLDPRRHQLWVHLEQERRAAVVARLLSLTQAIVKHLVPEVLGAEAHLQLDAVGARQLLRLLPHLAKRSVDVGAGRQEHAGPLMRGRVEVREPERSQRSHHPEGGLHVARAVIETR
jgi:hypothetical protein